MLHQAGDGVRREHTGGQGEVRVDHGCELSVARVSDGRVKTGPEHPQEDGSCKTSGIKKLHLYQVLLQFLLLLSIHTSSKELSNELFSAFDTHLRSAFINQFLLQCYLCPLGGIRHICAGGQ